MRLSKIIEREGVKVEKVLIPSNSGFEGMNPNPFKALGIRQSELEVYVDEGLGIGVLQKRGEDIPELCDYFTKKSVPVFGLTGDDLFDEYKLRSPETQLRLLDTVDWIIKPEEGKPQLYSRPTLCFIGIEGAKLGEFPKQPRVVVNRKYELISRGYLEELAEDYGVEFAEVRVLGGKTETELPERADFAVDMVVSGNTLKYVDNKQKVLREPQLAVICEVRQSDISVITSWPNGKQMDARLPSYLIGAALMKQYAEIEERFRGNKRTLTKELLEDKNRLVKKCGEEFAEFLSALARGDADNYLEEVQQSAAWLPMVGAVSLGIPAADYLKALTQYEKHDKQQVLKTCS